MNDDEYYGDGDSHICNGCDRLTGHDYGGKFDVNIRTWYCSRCWVPGENMADED
jgi:hypothetical protein